MAWVKPGDRAKGQSPPPIDRKIAAIGGSQHALIATRQLIELGLSRSAIDRRIQAGRLYPEHRGVYSIVIYPLMNGRKGARRLKTALARHRPAELKSGLEFTLHHLIGSTDLPRPKTNAPVDTSLREFSVDFLWPEQRLIVEVDGPPHLSKRSFEEDRERDSLLQLAGYRVVRITEHRLRTQSSRVLAELSAHLGR